jgi:AraC-like DNA-binding protein
MDLLSELFQDAGLAGRLLDTHALSAARGLRFPCERSLGLHVVLAGTVYVHAEHGVSPMVLEAGDIAVMGRGCTHVLATHAKLGRLPIETIRVAHVPDAGDAAITPLRGASSRASVAVADALLVSGAYQLWHTPVHPLFTELPAWHVRRAPAVAGLDPIALSVRLLADELRRDDTHPDALGRRSVTHGLLDVLFTYLLRDIIATRGADGTGWSHAIADPQVRRVVALMHADVGRDWTLESLARGAGLSRSVLAARFRAYMGDTPLAYLRAVRLQRAMRLLVEQDATLEAIAAAVGYGDAFSFSKAFKRAVGLSPGEFRRRDAEERGLAWRFAAG